MLNKYVDINSQSVFKIDLNTDTDFTNYRNGRHFPEGFLSQLEVNETSIKKINNEYNYSSYYGSYVRMNELTEQYPSVATISLSVAQVESMIKKIQDRNVEYDEVNSFNTLLPIAVRYTDNRRIWLIERPPFKANIQYKTSRASSHSKTIETSIWMPWTQMLLISDPKMSEYKPYLFFSDAPINSLDDLAIPCFYFNMYADGSMCLASSYTMLQQHLSSTESFDVATIYNFILNDYMTGGWNADLSLNVFDSICSYSKSAREIRKKCTKGDPEKNIKTATTPTGRISLNKYYNNFFNYFSSMDLPEVLSTITSMKSELQENRKVTYRSLINSVFNTSKLSAVSVFEDSHDFNFPVFSLEAIGFIHPASAKDAQSPKLLSVMESIHSYVAEKYESDINKLLQGKQSYCQIDFSDPKSFKFCINENFEFVIMNEEFDYSSLFSIHAKV